MFQCHCGNDKDVVLETRAVKTSSTTVVIAPPYIRRIRRCTRCGNRNVTYEITRDRLVRVKRNHPIVVPD